MPTRQTVYLTLGMMRDDGYTVTAYCEQFMPGTPRGTCGHSGELDLNVLVEKYGADARWGPSTKLKLRCSKCGSHNVSVRSGAPNGYKTARNGAHSRSG